MPQDATAKVARKNYVQELRKSARECDVLSTPLDDSAKPLVDHMFAAIQSSAGPPQAKQDAQVILGKYLKTFSTADDADDEQPKPSPGFRLRSKSFLLTYS